MTTRNYVDNSPTTNPTAAIAAGDTSFSVASLVGFPTAFPYTATLDIGQSTSEVVLVTNAVGPTVTVTRNYDGQGAFSHLSTGTFNHTSVAKDYQEANTHVNATTGVHGLTGALVDTTTAQTLSNKTLANLGVSATGGVPGVTVAVDGTTDAVDVKNGAVVKAKIDGAGVGTFANIITPGNLTVTGNSAITGNETVGGNLTVTGTLVASGLQVLMGAAKETGNFNAIQTTETFKHALPVATYTTGRAYKLSLQFGAYSGNTTSCPYLGRIRISSDTNPPTSSSVLVESFLSTTNANLDESWESLTILFKVSANITGRLGVGWIATGGGGAYTVISGSDNFGFSRAYVHDIGLASDYLL